MIALFLTISLSLLAQAPRSGDTPRAVRLVDVDGDGALDRLLFDADGGLRVALRVSGRDFAEVEQELPSVPVETVLLATDLDSDGYTDLYLVTPASNVALLGDGSGRFVDETARLGLRDGGHGLGVERIDLDGDGWDDLLLHNRSGDVVFYGTAAGYERDRDTPERSRVVAAPLPPSSASPLRAAELGRSTDGTRRHPGSGRRSIDVGHGGHVGPAPPGAGGIETAGAPPPTTGSVDLLAFGGGAATSVIDRTTHQNVFLDTTPTLGRLLPLGPELFVDVDGDVGMGTLAPAAALHVEGTSSTGIGLQVADRLTVRTDFPFVGVGRSGPISAFETFGVTAPTTGWGGMYMNTEGVTGQPFYGYATAGTARAWSYFHVPSAEWRLWIGGDRLSVASDGDAWIQGDIAQEIASDGLVKAAVVVSDNDFNPPTVDHSFNHLPGGAAITVTSSSPGLYAVDFGVDVTSRFLQATPGGAGDPGFGSGASAFVQFGDAFVYTWDNSGASNDTSFTLLVY